MTIKVIKDPAVWDTFVTSLPQYSFLHSWSWGQIQRRLGETVEYLGFYEGETLKGAALLVGVTARRGSHWLCPHGPLFLAEADFFAGLDVLTRYVRQHSFRAVALRIAPLLLSTRETLAKLQQAGFHRAPLHVHAELTWVLDITPTEERLLREMRKTTRHAISKGLAAGLTVDIVEEPTMALERFWPLYEQTRQRHGFVPFSRATLAAQLAVFSATGDIYTVVAAYHGVDLAAAILIQYGDTVYYYHGASLSHSPVPAAHLVQWRAITEAKRRGAQTYNFWGIAPADARNHPFAGITIFKKGFGGHSVDYAPAHDHPLSWRYIMLWTIDVWRRWRRGF